MRTSAFAALFVLTAAPALAGDEKATETLLLEQALHGMDGKVVSMVRVDIPPGWQTPRHHHPSNVFVYVLEGAIEVEIEGSGMQKASAGEVIYETPDRPMVGRNASSSEGARLIMFHLG